MTSINLLPWREERKEKRKREFLATCILVSILGLMAAFVAYMYFDQILKGQNEANQRVVAANQELDVKLKELDGLKEQRQEVIDRMKLIQDLQGVRPVTVHVFDELAKSVPDNMYLTKFSRIGDQFVIEGKAQDPQVVSDFLKKLGATPWFRNAFMKSFDAVTEVKQQQEGGVVPRPEDNYGTFVVTVDLGDINIALPNQQPQAASTGVVVGSAQQPASVAKPATAVKVN